MARPPSPPLHIALSLRIVAKHLHMPKLSIEQARTAIQRVARSPLEQDRHMVDELERATGMPIAELAKLTERWLPK